MTPSTAHREGGTTESGGSTDSGAPQRVGHHRKWDTRELGTTENWVPQRCASHSGGHYREWGTTESGAPHRVGHPPCPAEIQWNICCLCVDRMLKRYHLAYHLQEGAVVPGHTITMSSYAGPYSFSLIFLKKLFSGKDQARVFWITTDKYLTICNYLKGEYHEILTSFFNNSYLCGTTKWYPRQISISLKKFSKT